MYKKAWNKLRRDGFSSLIKRGYYKSAYLARYRLGEFRYPSTHIYDLEWDVLVILDACRVDLMREVADEYAFINKVDTIFSVGTMTEQWIQHTFTAEHEREISETHYITSNPLSITHSVPQRVQHYDPVYQDTWDDELGTLPPRPITDRAIAAARENKGSRYLLHYLQPHYPFIRHPELGGRLSHDDALTIADSDAVSDINREGGRIWEKLETGALDYATVWDAYKDNLRVALDDVGLLLDNIDAETVLITSDHGNALGENNTWGHPKNVHIPSIKEVPLIQTTATDSGEYEPSVETDSTGLTTTREEQLKQLGYR